MEASDISTSATKPHTSSITSIPTLSLHRLSIPFSIRFPSATGIAFITGLSLGLSHGSKTSGLRFRAENSHRFPTTTTGWYLYHKSKNYHMMLGGIKEGLKMGSRIAFWGGGFFLVEEAVDRLRGTKDFVSTLIAGLSISGWFSAWNKFPLPTAGRTIKAGLYGSLAFGLAQDALGLARGRRLRYVDFLMGTRRDQLELEEPIIGR